MMKKPMLYIFAGLPGSGKTTLSQLMARRLGIMHLRIDTFEQGLRDLCDINPTGQGYELAYRIATDNLMLGQDVIADSCNPIQLSRDAWQHVAIEAGANFRNIEVCCSDADVHKLRVETRRSTVSGLKLPGWQAVVEREYHPWTDTYISIDTAGQAPQESLQILLSRLDLN